MKMEFSRNNFSKLAYQIECIKKKLNSTQHIMPINIDLTATGVTNEFTVSFSWLDENNVVRTTTDPTPIIIGDFKTPQIIQGLTTLPTSVSPAGYTDYHLYIDTSGGDVNLSTLGVVAGVPDGGILHFHNVGSNSLLWEDAYLSYTYEMLYADILTLQWKADTAEWIIR